MNPFRLLVLAGLGYILYRLLTGKGHTPPGATASTGTDQHAADLLVEDPVCHTYIPQQGAEKWTQAGQTYYFCSPECRKRFQSEPRS